MVAKHSIETSNPIHCQLRIKLTSYLQLIVLILGDKGGGTTFSQYRSVPAFAQLQCNIIQGKNKGGHIITILIEIIKRLKKLVLLFYYT